ncbi:MAG: 30S ribosomal protein S20 [bacterium]|nr:30S ribosomal protein S20 [bacterium]
MTTVNKKQKRRLKKAKLLRKVLKRTLRNKAILKKVKVLFKNTKKLILQYANNKNEELKNTINEKLRELYKELDKAVSKGVIHKNESARKKSRITTLFNKFN